MSVSLNIGKCWSFNDDEQPPYPTIDVTLSTADRKATIRPKVDTGFNGILAIGKEAVRMLRLTPTGTVIVKLATGNHEVPVYAVKLAQQDLAVTYATFAIGTERSLVGRKLLENRAWLLDCKEAKFCALTQTEAN